MQPHRWQPTRLHHPWDSPGKNTGVGCHFFLQCMKVKSESEVAQSCLTLCDPIDGSPWSSPIPGILQARTLGWVAISFSNAWKSKVKVKALSPVQVLATPWTAAYQASPSLGFSRQEYWSGLPLPSLKMKSSCTKVSETQKQGEVRPSDKLFTVSSELQGYRHTSHTAGCGWGTPRWYNLT